MENIADTNRQFGERWKPLSFRFLGTSFLSAATAFALRDAGVLPYLVTYPLVFSIALLIDYWIRPRPTFSFGFILTRLLAFSVLMIFGLWFGPKLLVRWVWSPFAYGLPIFLSAMVLTSVKPIVSGRSRLPLWKRATVSAVVGVVVGLIGYFTHR